MTTPIVDELAALPIFAGVPAGELAPLAAVSFPRRFGRGQIVFSHGEPGDHLFVIRHGRVKITTSSPHGDELVLTVLGPGDVLGEVSLVDGGPRSAGAEALERSELLAVPVAGARTVLIEHPEALLRMAIELTASLRRLTGTAADLVFLDLPRRLAKLIVAGAADARLTQQLNQSELAAMLGASRQTVNRALGRLQQRGWILLEGSDITVVDARALSAFAGS